MSLPIIGVALKSAFAAIGQMGAGLQAALAIGSTTTQFLSAKGQAEAMEAANDAANDQARENMIADMDQTSRMLDQETTAAGQKIHQTQIDAKKAVASAQVAASAGGVSGLSVDALLGDIYGQEAAIKDSVNMNLEATGQQVAAQRDAVTQGYKHQINSRQRPASPSLIGAAIQAGSGVYDAYKDDLKIRAGTGR